MNIYYPLLTNYTIPGTPQNILASALNVWCRVQGHLYSVAAAEAFLPPPVRLPPWVPRPPPSRVRPQRRPRRLRRQRRRQEEQSLSTDSAAAPRTFFLRCIFQINDRFVSYTGPTTCVSPFKCVFSSQFVGSIIFVPRCT